jgi:hypothetical protein
MDDVNGLVERECCTQALHSAALMTRKLTTIKVGGRLKEEVADLVTVNATRLVRG